MAKFTLPINSIVKKGKTFNDNPSSENKLRVDIYRYNPDQNKNPYVDYFISLNIKKSLYLRTYFKRV